MRHRRLARGAIVGDVTDLGEWRERRAISEIADKVEAMARALAIHATEETPAHTEDVADG